MNVYLGFCSPDESEQANKKRLGKYSIYNSECFKNITAINPLLSNTDSIAKQYNKLIQTYSSHDCILVLAHDDVLITDKNWINKLKIALDKYDVAGLAGGKDPAIAKPCLWHLMCPTTKHSGTVGHHMDNNTFKTHFGPTGRVLLLDGLFLAFNPKKIYEAGVKFDETCPAKFHFYDIDFSLTCNKAKLKLSTINIDVIHASPGLRSYTKEWLDGQEWFLNKFNRGEY